MKNITKFGMAFLLMITLFGCNENENEGEKELVVDESQIIGSWKLVEASISAGGPQYLQEVENGEVFEFLDNGKFSSSKYDECTEGNFSIESSELSLMYDCDGFNPQVQNPDGAITYEITLGPDYFILAPTSVMCVEGCSYKYKKVTTGK